MDSEGKVKRRMAGHITRLYYIPLTICADLGESVGIEECRGAKKNKKGHAKRATREFRLSEEGK